MLKKAKCWRINVFKLWCSRRLQKVPWTSRSNPSILKEINPKLSLEGLMLKLKLQYFGHLMWRADSFEKTLMLGKIKGRRRRGWQRMRWHHQLNGHGFGWTPGAGDGQGGLVCCSSWGRKELDMNERLNWTELIYGQLIFNQGSKNVQFGKDSLLNKGFWKNWTDTCKGMKPDYHHTPYTKINSNWIKDLKIRPENTELLEGNLVVSSLTLSLVMLSFNLTESKGNTKWTSGTSSN